MKPLAVIGFLGSTLDAAKFGPTRWNKWRPTVGLAMHPDLRVDRLVLLHGTPHARLAEFVAEDVTSVSPETRVDRRLLVDVAEIDAVVHGLDPIGRDAVVRQHRRDYA